MTHRRAFVDYYRERDISPVKQDTSDLERHHGRRTSLYRLLGIPPLYVEGARVLEFGPGSGDNAIVTAGLRPARYVLVDGNPRAIAETRAQLANISLPSGACSVVESYIEDFASEERFDLVVAEGLVPFQNDPAAFASHIASFVRAGGLLVITTADAASAIGEIGRRLLGNRLAPPSLPYEQRRQRLAPVFAPHLATLSGMSRSVGDWIDDNIVHPLTGRLFSIADALATLEPAGFTIWGSSPQFLTDWRWYKHVYGEACAFNARALDAYHCNIANLADYRVTLPPHDPQLGIELLEAGDVLYNLMQANDAGDESVIGDAIAGVRRMATLLARVSPSTATSLQSLASSLASGGEPGASDAFAAHFGRGQQYLSFIRHPSTSSG